MKQRITLKEISKKLNVSISTVSKALSDSPEISDKTKEVIKAFAKEHNYKPNNIALSLKNQKTKNIGIIVPEIVHHFFSSIINGVERYATEKGYNVVVCLSDESFEKEVITAQMLANGSIDGFILSLAKETQEKQDFHHLNEVINQGMPIVMVDRVTDHVDSDKVIIDDTQGAFNAVNYLIEKGAKNIGLITMPDYLSVGRLRTQGYTAALENAGLPVNPDHILKLEALNGGQDEIKEFIEANNFDAVFGVTEYFAVTAMKVAQKLGMRIPEDFSVIGFTDGIISQCASPTLTTVSQHGEDIGRQAATMLINRLENEDKHIPYNTHILKTTLIHRESTK
ncbi:LacI family DNA-binding transcriptional regulator [Zhouia amylolytica]|uniref:Transcriptional regulator n=1 Tax=Zhouia amylolytica AD3 TaxID=1286632 RepID=W2UKH1_9FLAO|nr:LacI family DNA-binding transcriptional regulator [Zhouia amylolytica]ETN93802.1 transcriptional regulator [Zhouia amylolytica AD3]MCQ0111751.1 LacI family DNA-binding transcriptional regulator [Zhouia amylolytica]